MKAKLRQFWKRFGPAVIVVGVIVALYYLLRSRGDTLAASFPDRTMPGMPVGAAPAMEFSVNPAVPSEMNTPGYQRWNYAPVTFNLGGGLDVPKFDLGSGDGGCGCKKGTPGVCAGCTTFGDGPSGVCLSSTPKKQESSLIKMGAIHYLGTNIGSFGEGW